MRLAVVGEALWVEADRLGERVAAVEPGRLVRVGLVADLADELDVGGVAGAGSSAGAVALGAGLLAAAREGDGRQRQPSSATAGRDLRTSSILFLSVPGTPAW